MKTKTRFLQFKRRSFSLAFALSIIGYNAYAGNYQYQFVNEPDLISSLTVQQQKNKKITGQILDEKGETIIGASIKIKGINTGTITDFDGNFTLQVPDKGVLIISYIGYKTQEFVIGSKKKIVIHLLQDTKLLDEVVVIGYGTTSIRKNTASISKVDTKALKQIAFTDMASALQGRVPGVIVQQGSAEPGQNGASISIRGNGEPLYVIDGFVSNRQRFLSLSKSDIKSTTVLKDAASCAVYGMNAGNGVILVTTKNGQTGKFTVGYQANFSFNQLSYPTERMDAYEYAYAINNLNQGLGQGINSFKTPEEMADIKQNLNQYTNWEDVCMRKSAPQQEHTLSLSGGTKRLQFFGSLNYLGQDGIYSEDIAKYERYNYRSNISSNFDEIGLTIGLNVNGTVRDEKYPGASAYTIYGRLRDKTPFAKAFTDEGNISNEFNNPLLILQSPGFVKIRTVYNQLALKMDWELPWVEGLTVGFDGNYNIKSQDRMDWIETATYYNDQEEPTVEDPSNIKVGRSSHANYQYDVNVRVDYKKTFEDKHNVQATLIHNRRYYHGNNLSASSSTFYTTAIKQIQKGDASTITANNGEGEIASMGCVGRVHYDYDNRYMLEMSGRYDGSDNFPKKSRFGFFPAVSAGWAVSEEPFFQFIKDSKVIDYFKVRASYGQIGVNISNADHWKYAYLPTYNYNTNAYVVNGKLVNTVTPGVTPSKNMTWYTRDKFDLGFDINTLDEQLEISFDWFFEKTKGYLASANYNYTAPIGYDLPLEVSEAENRIEGIDGAVKYTTRFGEIDFSAGCNFTYYQSLHAKTNEDRLTLANPRIRKQGNSSSYVGTGYIGTKFYNTPNDVLNNPKRVTSKDLRPGDLWYKDVNGDGKIDGQDQSRYGHNSSPNFVYGIDVSAGYRGLNVAANVQGTGARQTYFSGYSQGKEGERRLDFKFQNNFWTPTNTNASLPRPGNRSLNSNNNYASSDFWARDSYYVRLKSLTVSYDLKYALLRGQSWIQNLTVFASGINLIAFGPSVKYGDPEANNFDGYAYPMMKTYSVGFQLEF